MSADLAEKYGVPYFRAAVGEANVVDAMLAHSADFRRRGQRRADRPARGLCPRQFCRHGSVVGRDGRPADEDWRVGRRTAAVRDRQDEDFSSARKAARRARCAGEAIFRRGGRPADGLRLDWADRWLLVRGSNTEPIVRAIAEAPMATEASSLCDAAAKVLATV